MRVITVALVMVSGLSGCMAQQADLKQTEKTLQQRIKQSNEELAQTRARQSQEISALREHELPQLRGELERAMHQAQELQAKQEDLRHRSAVLEQQTKAIELQTKKLEQLAAKLEAESATRYAWVQKSLDNQDARVSARLDDIAKAMDGSMAALKKDLVEAVQRTNEGLAKRVDLKLDEQQKVIVDNQHRLEQVSQKFVQFNQAMTGFKEALNGLHERVAQEEQASKTLAAKLDADTKAATAHATDVNKSVTSVAKALEVVGQKVTARLDEQDQRIETLVKHMEQVQQRVVLLAAQAASLAQTAKSESRASTVAEAPRVAEADGSPGAIGQEEHEGAPASTTTLTAPPETPVVEPARPAEAPDRARYERILALFREGDLEGARQGFSAFLAEYPNSDLAPNARYWLGETYYGKKDYRKAIDAYDKVELDYPGSEKVPAAILKKGYAYLALKDKKRASSAFKQVVTLYPKSPEAGKASDKLAQLKEGR